MNSNLHKAKRVKNDEFYTQLSDIEQELKHYKHHFKDKIIYLNCNDVSFGQDSGNFWRYFSLNFEFLGLKKLIATQYSETQQAIKMQLNGYGLQPIMTTLKSSGDFRSQECIQILKQADIIITNPPFSLFKQFVALLIENNKKFLVIGNFNAVIYKNIFPLLKDNKIWLGCTSPKRFLQPNGEYKNFGNISWYTNLEIDKRNEEMILFRKYYGNEGKYPKYDNYDAINIDKVRDIPDDYYGYMGVPISFMCKHNPKQFQIVGSAVDKDYYKIVFGHYDGWTTINGKKPFARIFIKRVGDD